MRNVLKNRSRTSSERMTCGHLLQGDTEGYHPAVDSDHLIVLTFAVHVSLELPPLAYLLLHQSEVLVMYHISDVLA